LGIQVSRIQHGEVLKDWTVPRHESVAVYAEPENAKFEAVSAALLKMGRKDDPHEVFSRLKWRPYGPGH